jgi:hypothetical protein
MAESIRGNAPKGATAGAPDVTLELEKAGLLTDADYYANVYYGKATGTLFRNLAARIRELEAEREWKPIDAVARRSTSKNPVFLLLPEAGDDPHTALAWFDKRPPCLWIESGLMPGRTWREDIPLAYCPAPAAVQVAEGSREAALHQSPAQREE